MALYARSLIHKVLRLACSQRPVDHAGLHASANATTPTPCLSFVIFGAKRSGSSIPNPCLLKSKFRCLSTARVPLNYGGMFHIQGDRLGYSATTLSCNETFCAGQQRLFDTGQFRLYRTYCQKRNVSSPEKPEVPPEKLSIWKRFKLMYKEYWYVLVPVHVLTSIVWYGSFYYIASSGFDLVQFMENMSAPESIIKPLRNSKAGYFAIAYAMYKIATPARYTVTLAGTTVSINYLKKWGYIKPIPNTAAIQQMIKDKRAAFQQGLSKRQAARRAKVKDKEDKRRSSQSGTKKP